MCHLFPCDIVLNDTKPRLEPRRSNISGGIVAIAGQTPIQEIERMVQSAAQSSPDDLTLEQNRNLLNRVITNEIDRWQTLNASYPLSPDTYEYITQRVISNIVGYGPLDSLFADEDVWEVIVNAADSIFVKRHSSGTSYHSDSFHDTDHLRRTLAKLLAELGVNQRKLEAYDGIQDVQLRNDARLHLVHPDLNKESTFSLNIRKYNGVKVRSIDELVERSMLSREAASFLIEAQRCGLSIVFSGPPGSGKTTLLSSLANELPAKTRVVIAEEVLETVVDLPNVTHLQSRPERGGANGVDLRRIASAFLRMSPDLAIVGEVRDSEVLPLIMTLTSGVPGYTTIHSSNARATLSRLRLLLLLSGAPLTNATASALVSEAIDIVVFASRADGTPKVREIIAIEDMAAGSEGTFTTTTLFQMEGGRLQPTSISPFRIRERAKARGTRLNFEAGDSYSQVVGGI